LSISLFKSILNRLSLMGGDWRHLLIRFYHKIDSLQDLVCHER